MGLGEQENMANLNWGKGEQCQNILGNKGTKKRQQILGIKKVGKSLHTYLKGHMPCCVFGQTWVKI